MEKQIKIAAKLYSTRDAAKRFFREKYADKLIPYKNLLLAASQSNQKEILETLIICLQLESVAGNGMSQMLFIAAAVELIEPSSDCLHDRYCDQQTSNQKCKSPSGCNFKD